MKEVTLKGPRVINGAVRYPAEGPIPVTDAEYDRLADAGAIADDEGVDIDDALDDLDDMKVADLKKVAEDEAIDLGTATKRDDILAAIRAHRLANAG